LNAAKKLAETSEENMKHGCIIVLGGSVQAMGVNKRTNDPFIHKDSSGLSEHAEGAALRRCKRTVGAVAYIARVNKNGEERMSRPCPKCMAALKAAGIKKIVYTVDSSVYL
jgi:tRNA(Arg) A34 adenosine deaminase TadA